MAAVVLPSSPGPADADVRYLDWGNVLTPPLGGPSIRLDRPGSRHGVDVSLPPLTGAAAMAWIQRLKRGLSAQVRMNYPLMGVVQVGGDGVAVSVTVTGGTSLAITGGTASATVKEGQVLSVLRGGKHYIYSIDADVLLNGSGAGTLAVTPMLRTPVTAGVDTVFLTTPCIEGFPTGNPQKWTLAASRLVGLQFSIDESE